MNRTETTSERIADWLRSVGLDGLAAFFLEAAGPLLPLGAQVAFLLEPLLGTNEHPLNDLARLLEDPTQVSILMENLDAEGDG